MVSAISRQGGMPDPAALIPQPTVPRNTRRRPPALPTHRNRATQPTHWKLYELRAVISGYRQEMAAKERAKKAKELQEQLAEQGVDRAEWPAIMEASGIGKLVEATPEEQRARRPAASRDGPSDVTFSMPGAYGHPGTAWQLQPTESEAAELDEVKIQAVVKGVWKVGTDSWVIEGDCPVSIHDLTRHPLSTSHPGRIAEPFGADVSKPHARWLRVARSGRW